MPRSPLQVGEVDLLASQSYSAVSTNQTIALGNLSQYYQIIAMLNVTAITGTSPTLQMFLQLQDNFSTFISEASTSTISTVTTNASFLNPTLTFLGTNCQLLFVVGGTTPAVTFTITLYGKY